MPSRVLNRRSLLKSAIGGVTAVAAPALFGRAQAQAPAGGGFKTNPFTLGIAAGEPAADGFVIWTRLAPEPMGLRGGLTPQPVELVWEVADDRAMSKPVRTGKALARIEVAHSVHIDVAGLEPARDYFYRFRARDVESPVGRVRTLPSAGADVARLRFAAAGCQSWEPGNFTAWRKIAEEDVDLVFHYGDYIYEHGRSLVDGSGRPHVRVMPEGFVPCYSLADYRRRYALYKSDADLQAAHASCAFLPSYDDHEVANNWASDFDPRGAPPEAFLFRRAAAFQAWYEHMPVRARSLPRGPDLVSYRSFPFGRLANLAVLDTRQYRSRQPCGDGIKAGCAEAREAARTMLGSAQERWLAELLRADRSTWTVLAQQVVFAQLDWRSFPWSRTSEAGAESLDTWGGYVAARQRMQDLWRDTATANPVVLSGDLHMGFALELKESWPDPGSRTVGVEFATTSVSSGGDGKAVLDNDAKLKDDNPHLRFASGQRGYTRHVVTPRQWQADFRVIDKVSVAGGAVSTARSFVIEPGRPGLNDA